MNAFTNLRLLYVLTFCIEGLLTLLIQPFYEQPFSLFALIDALATISLIFLTIGLIVFVIQGGFFDRMIESFRRFSRSARYKRLGEIDAEAPIIEYKRGDGRRSPITWPLIFTSLLLFVLSLFLSVLV
ncbi:DUF3899 domain-containing protein [Sporolactobacillus sp. THM7-7]|nr:DUF3899 domain-containing protein [Sporolactobacillus sp. THM7-7]